MSDKTILFVIFKLIDLNVSGGLKQDGEVVYLNVTIKKYMRIFIIFIVILFLQL